MDLEVLVAERQGEWARLQTLVRAARRPRSLSGPEIDEMVRLYQRAATDLTRVQSGSRDAALIARLSRLVADSRSAVTGSHVAAWRDVARFFTVSFPVMLYRTRRWWITTALVSLAVAFALGWWVDTHPAVQSGLLPPAEVRQLVNSDFAQYYRTSPGRDFAGHVWINNVIVAFETMIGGVLFGVLTIYALFQNMVNVGVEGGYMVSAGKANVFFGLIAPHGILELTAVFVAAGAGLRLGWSLIDPGPRRRVEALGIEGRATVTIALGLIVVLAVSGAIEGFVTPSGLPTWARIGIGVVAEAGFLTYIWTFGRSAARYGETGDIDVDASGDLVESG